MIRLFRVFIPLSTLTLLISEVLLITASFVLGAYIGLVGDPAGYLLYSGGLFSIGLAVLSILMGLYLNDLYTEIRIKSTALFAQQLCLITGAAFMIQGVVSYVHRDLRMPLHVMVPGSIFTVVTIFGWRLFFNRYVVDVVGRDRLLLVGSSPTLHDIGRFVNDHPEKGLQIIGVVDDCQDSSSEPETKYLGRFEALQGVVSATRPTSIVVGLSERRQRVPVSDLLALRFGGNVIEEAPYTYERLCGRISIKELRPSQLIYSGDLMRGRNALFYQTLTNLAVAVVGIIVFLPFMLLTAIAVKLSSAGPIFYRQVRVGMGGAPFTLYKFRSMCADAEAATGAVWASKDDPRVTPVG